MSKLQDVLDTFALFSDTADRTNLLLDYAAQFKDVPASIATRPFPKEHRVPYCESEAYAWAEPKGDGTLKLYFAVESPPASRPRHGDLKVAVGAAPAEVASVNPDIVSGSFVRASMGKGLRLM